nr:MAG TPA: hypothetical protein [Inoviridae sp. ctiYN10]
MNKGRLKTLAKPAKSVFRRPYILRPVKGAINQT